MNKSLFIGLMSGTSADGIDAALVRLVNGHRIELIDFLTYPSELKPQLSQLNLETQISLAELADLQVKIAHEFSQAVLALIKQNGYETSHIHAIGSHGQTIFHAPELGMSLQIGHPAIIAKQTNITTVADFRVDDMALGGQGAPLAPSFHQALFQDLKKPACVINIGGIANLSYLNAEGEASGFDTGPGNALMDEVCQQLFKLDYDSNGDLAAQGQINQTLLSALLSDPYFQQPTPKSTGRDKFNQAWLLKFAPLDIDPIDLLATLNQLSVETIAAELVKLDLPDQTTCLICGGGAYNQTLLKGLQAKLPNLSIQSTEQAGVNPNAIEAMMCAWLAKQRLDHVEIDLTRITGASRPAVLGGLWHP
ncbi:MAG: anhydro-N-acetylmuramic acid kinase [Thiomicrospira sp.]|uniref:anhydro-N-acetylmuramic acid kinase n=1 Tax=Thiomicrospira sp. TaxID=935 RepID=UPI0019E89668|nr:anhydro-N-acetylmuramic acid kinase [Thiomicrospira sp.]MBE0493674.1 anhydro-N-acetylmuramic acid kinase [Thiomicrospira sp.]